MPTEVYQEPVAISIDLLEAEPLVPGGTHFEAYPFPFLRKTGRKTDLELPTLAIENPFLKVTVAPTLGGRILRIFDKRTSTDVLPYSAQLEVHEGGRRGVRLNAGLTWSLLGGERASDLGPVDFQVVESADQESPAGVWLAEIVAGQGISVHLGISLPGDSALLNLEMRAVNRTFAAVSYDPSINAYGVFGKEFLTPGSAGFYDEDRRCGLILDEGDSFIGRAEFSHSCLRASRLRRAGFLAPFQTDAWSLQLSVFSGLTGVIQMSAAAALSLSQELVLQSAQPLGGKFVLHIPSTGAVEAAVEMTPAEHEAFAIGSLPTPPEGAVLLDNNRNELLRWPSFISPLDGTEQVAPTTPTSVAGLDERSLKEGCFSPVTRLPALTLLAIARLRSSDKERAAALLNDALSAGAEHPIVWWLKSISVPGTEEGAELLNAHYLAPLEPLLRASSFLAQAETGKDPNPLLDPLQDNPDAMTEVACWLWKCGMFQDLSRWVDECLRHRDVPMLRYVLASALLKWSRMAVEAAQHVAAAQSKPVNPPYPWRDEEFEVLQDLAEAFPEDLRLRDLLQYRPLPGTSR